MAGAGDPAVGHLAETQYGLIGGAQARACGLGRSAIRGRLDRGLWRERWPGVYFVGSGRLTERGEILAAVLSVPRGAAASGASVAWLRRLTPKFPDPVELLALGHNPARRAGIAIHRSRAIGPGDIHWIGPIPVVRVELVLLHRAAALDAEGLEAEVALALRNRLTSLTKLREVAQARAGQPGVPALRRLVAGDQIVVTRSEIERLVRRFIAAVELGPCEFNFRLADGRELDVYWPEIRFGIEVDHFFTHGDETHFESDRWRDADLGGDDIQIRRITRSMLRQRPLALAARLGAAKALRTRDLARPTSR